MRYLFLLAAMCAPLVASALELQGFVTNDCKKFVGMTVYAADGRVEMIDLEGHFHDIDQKSVNAIYVFNVIDNPIANFHIDPQALKRLKAVYVEDTQKPMALAFPVRFIEDLVIFYSLDGKSHVHTLNDIFKLRPAPRSALGDHPVDSYSKMTFEFSNPSARCPDVETHSGTKPTRVLSDKISIADFFHSFEQGYDSLESFQERTYLYARPFLFERHTRLGLVFQGAREEPALNLPLYFQWSSGEAYRFQSQSTIGMKQHEFLPNTEPVFSLRSDVKSHVFHGLFIGNVAGIPAGESVFLSNDLLKMTGNVTVQPSFNYLVMMGGDYGPYSASVGFFYPSYGIKVHQEYREVRGTSPTYAVRAMYTRQKIRLRAIGAYTHYNKDHAVKDDVLARTGENGDLTTIGSYVFQSTFLRGGVDYDFSPQLKASLDGIFINGSYKEVDLSDKSNDIHFSKITVQTSITQSFSQYVSLTGVANINQFNYESNFYGQGDNPQQRETRFFGTFEFIF